ncbi:MAG: hypothetical protein ABIP59_03405, partial [Roseateles sp.]
LWFIRNELMTAMAFKRGEQLAHQEITAISKLFDELLPEARGYKRIAGRFRVIGIGSTVSKHPTP